MTTEVNENIDFQQNVDNDNNFGKITEHSVIKEKRIIDPEKIRELSQPKKRYYLASCDDNIEMLKKQQEKGLTDILISLKKDYDNIKMENQKVVGETDMLEKKIKMIKLMDAKTVQKNYESKFANDNIKKAIEFTRGRLKEEEYKKKTLGAVLTKLKNDVSINEINLQRSYEKQISLNHKLQRQKLLENEIKAKGNHINSLILSQKEKNLHDFKEYSFQVKYYNTIIEQKMEFMRAAEERKRKQLKIAQEAKKTTGDKEEKENREKLQLLYLIDKYLQKKMEKELDKNKAIDEAFSKVKLICGTSNLKVMIEKILLRDKRYNYAIKKINEKEQQKKVLTEQIKKLEEQFVGLKNEVVVDIDSLNRENLKIVKSKDFESSLNNNLLIKEEIELNQKVNFNKELYNLVSLRYDQVINSLRKLCNEKSINYLKNASQNASNLLNNKSGMSTVDNPTNNNNNEINTKDNNKSNNNNSTTINNNSNIGNNNNSSSVNNNNARKSNNINIESNNTSKNLNNSNSITLFDENEEKKLINDYKEFLLQAEKTIESLFLMKTKKDFLQMITDKVNEFDDINKTMQIMEKHNVKGSKGKLNKSASIKKIYENNELEYCDDDNDLGKEGEIQEKIFRKYMNAEKRKMEMFINNEREGKKVKQ